jgi:hypothetical protein
MADVTQRSEFPNRLRQLARARFEFLEQPHILNGDDRLVRESLEESDLLVSERSNLGAPHMYRADRNIFTHQRYS